MLVFSLVLLWVVPNFTSAWYDDSYEYYYSTSPSIQYTTSYYPPAPNRVYYIQPYYGVPCYATQYTTNVYHVYAPVAYTTPQNNGYTYETTTNHYHVFQ